MPEAKAKPTVVVVDDSMAVRTMISTRLRLSGLFDVVGEGADGSQAVEQAVHHRPTLLLLDLSMPGMDGLDALPGILAVSPDTHVVVFSGFTRHGMAERVKDMGAVSFIEKSLPIDELPEVLLDLHRQRQQPGILQVVDPTPLGDEDADDVLGEHLERFREVFDQATIGMATMTLSGALVRANRTLATLMACEVDDLVGLDYGRLMAGRSHLLDEALAKINDEGSDLERFEHETTDEGEPRTVLVTLAPVRDSGGQGLYVLLQAQELTAQRAAESELHETEEYFRLLVDAVEDYAIFMLSPEGLVDSWNVGAQRSTGYRSPEIIGRHFRLFYPDEVQRSGHPERELEIALRDGRYVEEGWRIRNDGTRFWAHVVITAVRDAAGRHVGFAKVTRDVTERRHADQRRDLYAASLADANEELGQLNERLRSTAAEQAQILAVTAHELRSPVSALEGTAGMLLSRWDDLSDRERSTLLDGIVESSGRMQRLVSDLLTVTTLEKTADRPSAPATSVLATLQPLVDAATSVDDSVRVHIASDASDPEVVMDPVRLAQVLDNLLRNALVHGESPVEVTVAADDQVVEIAFSDAGPGVAPGVRDVLFDKFVSGGRTPGTGLGLFIVREIARAHGGDATYSDGATSVASGAFRVTLPAA